MEIQDGHFFGVRHTYISETTISFARHHSWPIVIDDRFSLSASIRREERGSSFLYFIEYFYLSASAGSELGANSRDIPTSSVPTPENKYREKELREDVEAR